MGEATVIVLTGLLMGVGVAGAVLPFIPGPALIFVAAVLYAWPWDHFAHISMWMLLILLVITALAQLLDFLMGAWGARKFGGTWRGVVGALVGTVVGIFLGFWPLLFLPIGGAIAGELLGGMPIRESGKVGTGTVVGMILGIGVRLGACVIMITLFFVDYFYNPSILT